MLLLFQLLNYGVISAHGKLLKLRSSIDHERFLGEDAPHASQQESRHPERKAHGKQHDRHANHDGVAEHLHSNLQYQRKNWSPKNEATIAMLPRNTPNGMGKRRSAMLADSHPCRRARLADS